MVNFKEKLLILCAILLALCLRIHYMTRGLFYDELYTVIHCIQAPNLFDALYKNFTTSNHIGYTAIAYLTCHLLGTKEWVLRLPALLFGLGSIFIFWHWSRKYFGKTTAILGSLFLALAPAHIIWSASGRGYSACIFFTILSTSLYLSLIEKPSLKTAITLAISNIFGFAFQILFLFPFLAQFLHFLLISILSYAKHRSSIKNKLSFYTPLSIGFTILGSILIYFPTLATIKGVAADPNQRAFIPDFPLTLLKDLLSLPLWPLGLFCLILMCVGFMRSNKHLPHWRVYAALLFLMVLPVWLSKPVFIYPRFFAYFLPFLFLLLANGITSVLENSPNRARPFILSIIIIFAGFIFWTWFTKPSKIVADFHYKFRDSVEFAESISSPETRFCAFGPEDGFFQFYSDRPVTTFETFEDFLKFYKQENQVICFSIMGPPMPVEHQKILLFLLQYIKPKEINFDNVMVIDLKG
jgi:mannosyltransferase